VSMPRLSFGMEMTKHIIEHGLTLTALRLQLQRDHRYKVSVNQLSDLTRSDRLPTPDFINAFGRCLELSKDQVKRLHRAAAIDKGYDIGGL
jgi:hypothetical protein